MNYIKLYSLLLSFFFSSQLLAQSLQLTDSAKNLGFEVFLIPGIGPSGEKILKFSFARLSAFEGHVSRDSIVFNTRSGKNINMFKPIKNASTEENVKSRSSIFSLAPAELELLKKDDVESIGLFVNGQRQNVPVTKANAASIKRLAAKHF